MTFTSPEPPWPQVHGVVVQGHQVASGQAANSPYPEGSIAMQMPIFQTLGLDLSACFAATLNVSIAPQRFRLGQPPITFPLVAWTDLHPPETFSFIPCQVQFEAETYAGWVYYPHPETKQRHFQNDTVLEILAPPITGLGYGSPVVVSYDPQTLIVNQG